MKELKNNTVFCCFSQYCAIQKDNHGAGRNRARISAYSVVQILHCRKFWRKTYEVCRIEGLHDAVRQGCKVQVNWVGICPSSKLICPPPNLPIAQNCPPSKLSCPQKNGQMGTTVIRNREFKPKFFAKLTNPKLKIPLEHHQNRQYLSVILNFVNI